MYSGIAIKLPKKIKVEVRALSKDEQKTLEETVLRSSNALTFAIFLDLYTGLRVGELTGLKISDIDFDKKELYVKRTRSHIVNPEIHKSKNVITEPKTAKGLRTIPLPEFIIPLLRKYIENRNILVEAMKDRWCTYVQTGAHSGKVIVDDKWVDEGFVFVSTFGTTPRNDYFRLLFKNCLIEAGIEHLNFHALIKSTKQ